MAVDITLDLLKAVVIKLAELTGELWKIPSF
jgi:hypothetical protein